MPRPDEVRVGATVCVSGSSPAAIAIASQQLAQALAGALQTASSLAADAKEPVRA